MQPICLVAALLAIPQADAASPRAARDPRKQPLTVEDALFVIPDVTGRAISVGDIDGDGVGDLFVERGGQRGKPERIDAVRVRDGTTIRTLWRFEHRPVAIFVWDAGDDVDGDGVADLLLGFPQASAHGEASGSIHVVSGKDGSTLYTSSGESAFDRLGCSVAFVGDVDEDERADFAVGVPQLDPCKTYADFYAVGTDYSSEDGFRPLKPGYVSIRSGRTGREIRRFTGFSAGRGFGLHIGAMRDPVKRGAGNLLVQCDLRSGELVRVFDTSSDTLRLRLPHWNTTVGCGGDLDGDGAMDFVLDEVGSACSDVRGDRAQFVSGKSGEPLFELRYPDIWSDWGVTVPLGDIDGDGCADIAFGEANFNLNGPDSPDPVLDPPDLRKLTLAQALALESSPWTLTWESGCAIVYSGRTQKPILGVWARPGSHQGLGLEVAPLPDVSGDGLPDVLVADMDKAYVFAGPGRAPQ